MKPHPKGNSDVLKRGSAMALFHIPYFHTAPKSLVFKVVVTLKSKVELKYLATSLAWFG